jgi:dTMP kinase
MSKFITFEGGEGTGKSTQIRMLADYLRRQGKDVLLTREPGGSAGAEKIRELLLSERKNFSPKNEVLLNFAARLDHVETLIAPALAAGKTVLSDRFFDSTYIYQGVAQGVDKVFIDEVRRLTIGNFAPHLTILLDIDPKIALARAKARGDANHFEAMDLSFHIKIREGFLQLAEKNPQRFVIIDADKGIDDLHAVILRCIKSKI